MSAVLEARESGMLYSAPTPLVRDFDVVATASSGIERVRQLALALAVQGLIVEQIPCDGDADELLRSVRKRKAEMFAAGLAKRDKPFHPIDESEFPHSLPNGWRWTRLGDLLIKIGAGSTPLGGREVYTNTGVKFLRSQNVWNSGLSLNDVALIPAAVHEKMSGTKVLAGDLLFNITGASIGRCAIVPDDFDEGNVSQHVTILRPAMPEMRSFLHLVLISARVQQTVMDVQVGVSREGLSIAKLSQFLIPIPPLAEQRRIVARVEELMKLCDALEQSGRLADEQHARLTSALFDALAASESAHGLAENWRRVAEHFDLLLDRPDAVDAFEQAIAQLAVRGLLMPQIASDEPADALLQRLRTRRPPAYARTSSQAATTEVPAPPYELPNAWSWAALDELVENMGSGWSPACDEGERSDTNRWAVLRTTAVQVMEYRSREHKTIPLRLNPRPDIEVRRGDVLITRAGPLNRVGISCWVDETPPRLMLSDKIVRFHPTADEMLPAFLVLALNAGWTRDQLEAAKTGMAASQVNISQADLRRLLLPVCSKSEQRRIVARVEELRLLCSKLRNRLAKASEVQSNLANALVAEIA